MPENIPIFPLHTVLFPGGLLPLKIFEARYIDMVSECLHKNSGFGVCLIRMGSEVGQAAVTETVGTCAGIMDFRQYPDGLLGITVQGQQRFQLINARVQADNLLRGEIIRIADEPPSPVPARFQALKNLFLRHADNDNAADPENQEVLDDAVSLGYRLAELVPSSLQEKQGLLEMTDPVMRLEWMLLHYSQKDGVSYS